MDAWMRDPGARVVGHQASVQRRGHGIETACTCGYSSTVTGSVDGACLSLVLHLQRAVREGAQVTSGDDGLAGVREPRRPRPPLGGLSVALRLDEQ